MLAWRTVAKMLQFGTTPPEAGCVGCRRESLPSSTVRPRARGKEISRRRPEPADRRRDSRRPQPPAPVPTPAGGGEAPARPLTGRSPAGGGAARSGGSVPSRLRLLFAGAGAAPRRAGSERRVAGTGRPAEVADPAAADG